MKNKSLLFSIVASAIIIVFFFVTNYTTSMAHPWFIYPTFVVLWWPIAMFFGRRRDAMGFAIAGSILTIAFFFVLNYVTSMAHPWFIYPTFAVLWWPIAVFFARRKDPLGLAIAGSILTILFFFVLNYVTSMAHPWFIYPTFAVLWWPMAVFFGRRKDARGMSIAASILTIAFFFVVNYVTSMAHPWFIYPAFAVLWWPLAMFFGSKGAKVFSIVSAVFLIAFFALVNYVTSPSVVWFFFPSFVVLWWPLSVFFAKKKYMKLYSIIMSLFMLAFFVAINMIYSPGTIWFTETIFYLAWWPVVMLLGRRARTLGFSIVGAAVIIAYYVMLYYLKTPDAHPWYLYIVLPAIWWPVSMAFRDRIATLGYCMVSLVTFVVYYIALNLIFTPQVFWSIYVIYPALWGIFGMYFARRKQYFAYSIFGAIITILFFSIINYMHSPNHIWAVYPSFLIIWWPLSMYFFGVRKKKAALAQ